MSDWRCPADGAPLEPVSDGLQCGSCATTYPVDRGVVQFDRGDRESPSSIVELHALMREMPADAATTAFCSGRGCRRIRNGADWKLLLPVGSGAHVLEVGPGFGDITLDLASRAAGVTVLASDAQAGGVVRALAAQNDVTNVAVGAIDGLDRLPVGDATQDAVTCVEAGLRGFDVTRDGLTRLAGELRRVAAPGATVLVGQSNPLHRLPGVASLRGRLSSGSARSLDGVIHDALIRSPGRWSGAALLRAMSTAGFSPPRIYAPIPDEERARAIVPVADKAVVRYFLSNLVRRNAPLTRAALAAVRPMVALGLFPRMVPYSFYVFDVPEPT